MPTLAYWKIRGLAQPIRLLLNYVGEDFTDVQYETGDAPDFNQEGWINAKPTLGLDFPNLPYFIDGDIKITQSNAILRHIARKHKLDGGTEKEKAVVDMILEQTMDLRNGFIRLCYNPKFDSLKDDYCKNVQSTFAAFEKKLGDDPWFVGENVTVADFHIYEMLDQHRIMQEDILKSFPKLEAFINRFEALPPIKTYMESDKFMRRPVNNKMAGFIGL